MTTQEERGGHFIMQWLHKWEVRAPRGSAHPHQPQPHPSSNPANALDATNQGTDIRGSTCTYFKYHDTELSQGVLGEGKVFVWQQFPGKAAPHLPLPKLPNPSNLFPSKIGKKSQTKVPAPVLYFDPFFLSLHMWSCAYFLVFDVKYVAHFWKLILTLPFNSCLRCQEVIQLWTNFAQFLTTP